MTGIQKLIVAPFIFLLCVTTSALTAQAEEVDLELVLAMDASGSISDKEYVLQLNGTAAAFRDPAIQAAIVSGPVGKIAVNVMLWSDAAYEKVSSGWFVLDGQASAERFASMVQIFQLTPDGKISFGGGGTGIGSGVQAALKLLNSNQYQGLRRVIDVSGDGVETEFWFSKSIMIADAKRLADAANVTINGLPIITRDFPNLDEYYREKIITGAGSFVMKAEGFEDFGRAIKQKLLREISSNLAKAPSRESDKSIQFARVDKRLKTLR